MILEVKRMRAALGGQVMIHLIVMRPAPTATAVLGVTRRPKACELRLDLDPRDTPDWTRNMHPEYVSLFMLGMQFETMAASYLQHSCFLLGRYYLLDIDGRHLSSLEK